MTDNLQEQINQIRRQNILDAAATVFAQKGFHASTIKDIARRASVADGTIYNYYANKQALLIGIFEEMHQRVKQDVVAPINHEEIDLHTVLKTFIAQPLTDLQQDNFALFRIVVSEAMVNEELRQLYYEKVLTPMFDTAQPYLQYWIEQEAIQAENTALVIRILSALITGLMVERIMGDDTLTQNWDQLPDLLTDLLLNGLKAQ